MTNKKNVLFLSIDGFKNDSRMTKQAITLGKEGYKVKIITIYTDGLEKYEKNNYFEVYRLKLFTKNLGKNKIIQALKMLEFNMRILCKLKKIKFTPDIIQVFTPYPLTTAYRIKKFLNKNLKIVYDPREYVKGQNISSINKKMMLFIERIYISKIDVIVTVGECISNFYKKDYFLKNKPSVIRNIPFFYDNKSKQNKLREKLNIPANNKILLYQGYLTKGRGLNKILDVFSKLPKTVNLVFMGEGELQNELKIRVYELDLRERVHFLLVKNNEVLEYTNSADIGICLIEDICESYYYSLPNKLFEFIQGKLPIICSDFPEMSKIVLKYRIGEVVNPNKENEILEKIIFILNNLEKYKENLEKAKRELCWENESKKLIEIYKKL